MRAESNRPRPHGRFLSVGDARLPDCAAAGYARVAATRRRDFFCRGRCRRQKWSAGFFCRHRLICLAGTTHYSLTARRAERPEAATPAHATSLSARRAGPSWLDRTRSNPPGPLTRLTRASGSKHGERVSQRRIRDLHEAAEGMIQVEDQEHRPRD